MSPKLSVILATYNRPRELRLVMEGLRRQEGVKFEVIVADDGSTAETEQAVEEIGRDFPHPVIHVRQEDEGFRLAAIRNRAIENATGDLLVFLDGDCVPFPDFLRAHADAAEDGAYLCGQRLRLDEDASAALDAERIGQGGLGYLAPITERIRETFQGWRAMVHKLQGEEGRPKLIACNASAARQDVLDINGFDERFVGWGGEDDDFARRLRRRGLRPKSVIGKARLLHLHHAPDPTFKGTVRSSPNYAYLHRGYFLTRCREGLQKRAVQDLSVHFLCAPEPAAETVRGWDPAPSPCDVDVLFVPTLGEAGFHPESDVRVLVVRRDLVKPGLLDLCHLAFLPDGAHAPAAEARLAEQGKPMERLPPTPEADLPGVIRDSLDPLI